MGVCLRLCATMSLLFSVTVSATESGDLLDAFNDITLQGPSVQFKSWEDGSEIDSSAYKSHYNDQFRLYVVLANQIADRATGCALGDLEQADGYQSMTDVEELSGKIDIQREDAQELLQRWISNDSLAALASLDTLVPKLTVSYSRMLFELSTCSGYLYGELVN